MLFFMMTETSHTALSEKEQKNALLDSYLEIIAENLSPENYITESVPFNGEPVSDFRIPTEKLMSGGKLVFKMK